MSANIIILRDMEEAAMRRINPSPLSDCVFDLSMNRPKNGPLFPYSVGKNFVFKNLIWQPVLPNYG